MESRLDISNDPLDVAAKALREVREREGRIRRGRALPRVPIVRQFHSRKSVFLYCVNKVVARLRPMWRGNPHSLRRSVRRFLRPHRKNLGLLGRIVQTLNGVAVAVLLLTAILAQPAHAHERSPLRFSLEATPSGLSYVGRINRPAFGDLDGDGDLDMLAGADPGTFFYFENTGTASAPAFAASTTLGGLSDVGRYSAPVLGDLDGDGDLDLLTGGIDGTFRYFENTGSATVPAFAASTTLSGFSDVGTYSAPALGDLDGDGDLDLLTGDVAGTFRYFENTGSATVPAFAASTTLSGFSSLGIISAPSFGDLDGDGDLDVLAGNFNGRFFYFENTGTATVPAFAASTTLGGLSDVGRYSGPALGDLDGDGDLDLLTGEYYGSFIYFENAGRSLSVSATELTGAANPLPDFSAGIMNPAVGDLDGDGDLDMLVADWNGTFTYFQNTGTATAPVFAASTTLSGLSSLGIYTTVTLGDLDGDGDLDVLAGEEYGNFFYFENTGTATSPAFAASTTLSGLSDVGRRSSPTFGDLDGDGDLDVLSGEVYGAILYFKNVGSAIAPSFSTSTLSGLSNVGYYSTPTLGDVDGDGDLDLLSGERNGIFLYFKNTGSAIAPAFSASTLSGLTSAVAGTYSAPAFGDLDGDGDLDVVSGDYLDDYGAGGGIRYFEISVAGTTAPVFAASTTLSGLSDVGAWATPALGDLDGDGDLDVLAGEILGALYYFENTGTASVPAFAASITLSGLTDIVQRSSPAIGDLDGDGDLDVLIGEYYGRFFYFENTGTATVPAFAARATPSGLSDIWYGSKPTFGDVDGDGDLDVLAGEYTGRSRYFENTGTATAPAFAASTTLGGLSKTGAYSSPSFGDLDGDGDLDVLRGDTAGTFLYFENTGTATVPAFAASTTPSGLSDIGLRSHPAFGDLDGDGDLDVLVGKSDGSFSYFENVSLFTIPAITEGDRIVVPISKNGTPVSFALNLNATEDLGHTLTWSVRLAGGNGTAVASGTGTPKTITYTPNADFVGTDVFIVEVANEHGRVDSATVVVRVFDPNNAIALRNNFVALDSDSSNGLTLAEARTQFPGMTQLEFDLLDTNEDGVLGLLELMEGISGAGGADPVYVNFSVGEGELEDGASPATGFNTLLEGASFVTTGGTVIISSGSSSETLYIPKAMTLQSGGGKVTLGQTP